MKKTKVKVMEYRGITLMSLVITVIVLLILAGISIQMISGDNGILKQASNSKSSVDEVAALEYIKLSVASARSTENNINKTHLENELKKYFKQVTVEINGKNDYMMELDGKIYNIDNSGQLTSGYKKEVSEDGVIVSTGEGNYLNGRIYGNSVQDGTPSPDNPIDIQSVGDLVTEGEYKEKYKIPIRVSGKNLIKYPYYNTTKTENGVTYTDNGNGSITVSGTATTYGAFYLVNKMDISAYQNKNLTFSLNATNNVNIVSQVTTIGLDGTTTISVQSSAKNITILVTEEMKYLTIVLKRSLNQETRGIFKPQLELGSTATKYELYQTPITTDIYLSEPLRKIGDYADYIDFENGKVIRNVGNAKVLSGSYNKADYENVSYLRIYKQSNGKEYNNQSHNYPKMSNSFINGKYNYDGFDNSKYINTIVVSGISLYFIGFKPNTSLETMESLLANSYLYYILATPREETIELPDIKTLKGTNIITTDTTIQPSKMEFVYYKLNKEI